MIKKIADDDVKVKLRVSFILHDEIRSKLCLSVNFPLADLRESLEYWYRKQKQNFLRICCLERYQ
jgi:23S rRNA (adenine2503-C2)-methyltransferase